MRGGYAVAPSHSATYARTVTEFLSAEWIDELDAALGATASPGGGPFALEQVVNEVPGRGVVRYRLVIADGTARVSPASDAGVDVRLTTDYETAVSIAQGEANAQVALAHGRLRITGDSEALVRHADQLGRLAAAVAALRTTTTFTGS